jgi:hypothetical protein
MLRVVSIAAFLSVVSSAMRREREREKEREREIEREIKKERERKKERREGCVQSLNCLYLRPLKQFSTEFKLTWKEARSFLGPLTISQKTFIFSTANLCCVTVQF